MRLLRRSAAIGDTPLFRAPRAKGPWQIQHALDLLHRTEAVATAELQRRKLIGEDEEIRLGFHALRRKWGSDRKGDRWWASPKRGSGTRRHSFSTTGSPTRRRLSG